MKGKRKKGYVLLLVGIVMVSFQLFLMDKLRINAANNNVEKEWIADTKTYGITTKVTIGSTKNKETYYASVSPIQEFFDQDGNYNVAYSSNENVYITKLDTTMKVKRTICIKKLYPKIGDILCDKKGNYYIIYGQTDTKKKQTVVTICIAKYNESGTLVEKIEYMGSETALSTMKNSGTYNPFYLGNCNATILNNTLACTFAREMYNGQQSNYVIYANISTMKKTKDYAIPYTSHSFEQQVMTTKDGNYLFVDKGDTYPRGFKIELVNGLKSYETVPFHFREGYPTTEGYYNTFASFAGIGEVSTGYVLAGASEKTLSFEPASSTSEEKGNESRNIFLQILKKDFWNYQEEEMHVLTEEERIAQGNPVLSANTETFLSSDTRDFGVKWITDYTGNDSIRTVKMAVTEEDKIIIIWEKVTYVQDKDGIETEQKDCYYTMVSNTGEVLEELKIPNVSLNAYESIQYKDGMLYWSTSDGKNPLITIHQLKIGKKVIAPTYITEIQTEKESYVELNSQKKIKVSILPVGATNQTLKYEIGNKKIATVDKNGIITGHAIGVTTLKISTADGSNQTKETTIYVRNPAPQNVTAKKYGSNQIKVTWKKVEGVQKYSVYRATKKDGSDYKLLKTVKTNSYLDTNITIGKYYYYYIVAENIENQKYKTRSTKSSMVCMCIPAKPSNIKLNSKKSRTITLTWKTAVGASGYEIFRSTSKTTEYARVTSMTYKTLTYTDKNVKANNVYYYKIRSYKAINGKKVYSAFSTPVAITVRK